MPSLPVVAVEGVVLRSLAVRDRRPDRAVFIAFRIQQPLRALKSERRFFPDGLAAEQRRQRVHRKQTPVRSQLGQQHPIQRLFTVDDVSIHASDDLVQALDEISNEAQMRITPFPPVKQRAEPNIGPRIEWSDVTESAVVARVGHL